MLPGLLLRSAHNPLGRDIPGFKLNYLRLLREINEASYNLGRIEQILKEDVAIAYKLLRYINSAAFGLRNRVSSLRESLVLLGQDNIRKLASLWALAGIGKDRPEELLTISLARARFCEVMAPNAGLGARQSELFMLGMFSLIDVIVSRPMADIVEQLPISEGVREGLVEGTGPLRPVLDCVLAYERGDWTAVSAFAQSHHVNEATIPECYIDSIAMTASLSGVTQGS